MLALLGWIWYDEYVESGDVFRTLKQEYPVLYTKLSYIEVSRFPQYNLFICAKDEVVGKHLNIPFTLLDTKIGRKILFNKIMRKIDDRD